MPSWFASNHTRRPIDDATTSTCPTFDSGTASCSAAARPGPTSLAYASPSTLPVGCSIRCSEPVSPECRSLIVIRIAVTSPIDDGHPVEPNEDCVHHVVLPDGWLLAADGSGATDDGVASVYSTVTPEVAPCRSIDASASDPENALPR